jgi:hypothetical protein
MMNSKSGLSLRLNRQLLDICTYRHTSLRKKKVGVLGLELLLFYLSHTASPFLL